MVHISEIEKYKGIIDVMILCGGSATDLPKQAPEIAEYFNTVDSFDTHAKIPDHFKKLDEVGKDYTFWGRGVSQGHSDAIRRVEGVKDAVQYTVPVECAMDMVASLSVQELLEKILNKEWNLA